MATATSVLDNQVGRPTTKLTDRFRKFATVTSKYMGSSVAFCLALSLVIGWAAAGPYYEYSDSRELVINTSTTIITFLMVFLIQNTQNRDARRRFISSWTNCCETPEGARDMDG